MTRVWLTISAFAAFGVCFAIVAGCAARDDRSGDMSDRDAAAISELLKH